MRRRDCGCGGPRSRAPPGCGPGRHRRDAGDLPEGPPALGAQTGSSPGGWRDVQSRQPRAWPVGHTPAAARPPRPAGAHLHREPLAPRALGLRLRRSDRARHCARSSAQGAAGVGRAAAAWAAAEEEEDSGAPLWGDPPSSRPLCSSRPRSLPGRGGAGRGAPWHFLSWGRKDHGGCEQRVCGAGEAQCDNRLAASRWLSPPARRDHLPTPGRGSGVAASSSSQHTEGLLGKEGRGRPPSCFWGLLGFSWQAFSLQPATWLIADKIWGGGWVASPGWRTRWLP